MTCIGDCDSCAAGRARDTSTDEDETRGGRDDGRGGEEGSTRVHRGIRDFTGRLTVAYVMMRHRA